MVMTKQESLFLEESTAALSELIIQIADITDNNQPIHVTQNPIMQEHYVVTCYFRNKQNYVRFEMQRGNALNTEQENHVFMSLFMDAWERGWQPALKGKIVVLDKEAGIEKPLTVCEMTRTTSRKIGTRVKTQGYLSPAFYLAVQWLAVMRASGNDVLEAKVVI